MTNDCRNSAQVSAYVDGELAPGALREFEAHLSACTACSKLLLDVQALRAAFRALPDERPGFDLNALLDQRLATRRPHPLRPKRGLPWWQWVPSGLAAAASVAGGLALGSMMAGTSAALASPPPEVMAVFDLVPPGGLCLLPQSCPSLGVRR